MPYSVFVRAWCIYFVSSSSTFHVYSAFYSGAAAASFLTFTVIIFLLHSKIPVFTALPFSNMLFICISLFQTSQNAHQDWPAGCPPVLPEEICGWFLSTQQVRFPNEGRISQLSVSIFASCMLCQRIHMHFEEYSDKPKQKKVLEFTTKLLLKKKK